MKTLARRFASETGSLRPIQYVLLMGLAAILYSIVMYSPSLMHQMAMGNIADDAAAKMNVEFKDDRIRKEVVDQALIQNVHVGPQDIELHRAAEPGSGNKNLIVIRWQETVDHLWGRTQILHKKVTARAGQGELAGVAGVKK